LECGIDSLMIEYIIQDWNRVISSAVLGVVVFIFEGV
jgi:hypothetical protein